MSRKLHLSPSNVGVTTGFEEILNHRFFVEKAGNIDFYSILGGHLIQCGVEKIITWDSEETRTKKFKYLNDKISYYKDSKFTEIYERTNALFRFYIREYDPISENHKDIYKVESFLGELFFSIEMNSSFPILLGFPNIQKIKNKVPIELYKPLEFLFNSIKQEEITLPTAYRILNKNDIMSFRKVVESKKFKEYCDAHSEAENSRSKIHKTVSNIKAVGKSLYVNNSRFLTLNKTILSTLETGSKLIDLFAGKLPSILSEYSVKLLSNFSNSEKRVVFYDCTSIHDGLIKDRIKLLTE